ncbi:unnamed protein product [Pseudo-nitzschia multistriata]|uniref:DNA polymerase II subunit 2 n=1 Tax=Pseudo-nitzschia multistriata TaxID=183589 RepID=A0A448Z2Q1_9STRA|nr:unnamed protein product [Pseudo-nitzschia multistriata]
MPGNQRFGRSATTGNHRRQLARACKKFGLLVQPSALKVLAGELEARGGAESAGFLEFLALCRDRLASSPRGPSSSSRLLSLSLVEEVLTEEDQRKEGHRQDAILPRSGTGSKRSKVVLREEGERPGEEEAQSRALSATGRRRGSATKAPTSYRPPWKIVSAFETPRLVYDSLRRRFRYDPKDGSSSSSSLLMGTASDLMDARIQRYELVKQKVDRHREHHRESPLTTIDRLLGTASGKAHAKIHTTERTLLGMLRSHQGGLELEDPTGSVPLRIDPTATALDDRGVFLEGSLVLATGSHEESPSGTVFSCRSVELPPLEPRETTARILPPPPGGGPSGRRAHGPEAVESPVPIYALSNLCLDEAGCLERVGAVVDRMVRETGGDGSSSGTVGAVLVLFGNFGTPGGLSTAAALDELATLLAEKKIPARHSVLLVPGPADVGSNACWPLPAWDRRETPSSLHPFLAGGSNSGSSNSNRGHHPHSNASGTAAVHLCTNPCRLDFSDGRRVVLLRKDLVRESLRHRLLADGPRRDSPERPLASMVLYHALSQSHLSPHSLLAPSSGPVYWRCDHSMGLVPLPDLVVLGLDAEYLEEGVHYGRAGCRFVAPLSNPSRGEWQCAVAVLGRTGAGGTDPSAVRAGLHVEFDNDDESDGESDGESESDDEMEGREREEPGDEATANKENDDDDDDDDSSLEPTQATDRDIFERYRALGGTQTDTQLSQSTQLSAY